MKKSGKGARLGRVLALCACAAALGCFPMLLRMPGGAGPAQAQRTLLTAWVYGDGLNASPWIRKQAAAYQKSHPGVHIWVRTVTAADMALVAEDPSHAAPDLLFFMAGAGVDAAQVRQVQPVCMAGYVLVMQAKEGATAAPTSLFGVTPTPEKAAIATPVPRNLWPQPMAADDALGAYFLQQMDAPGGAQLLPQAALEEAFGQGSVQAALLSTVQLRALQAQGVGTQLLCAAQGSDLVLHGAVLRSAQPQAEAALAHFVSPQAQYALRDSWLFSAQQAPLYGAGTPIWQAVEAALGEGWLADAFLWTQEKEEKIRMGQVLYTAK